MLTRLVRTADRLSTLVGGAVAVLVPAMAAVICWEIVARYVFKSPTIWAHDLSVFMFGYLGLLAGGYAHRKRRHIAVDILYDRAPLRAKAALDAINAILAIFFLALVAALGWQQAMQDFAIGARLSTEWAPPKAHFMLVIPISAGLLVFQVLANLVRSVYLGITGKRLPA